MQEWQGQQQRYLKVLVKGFPSGSQVKNLPAKQETREVQVRFLAQEDSLEEGMGTHSSILAWRIPMDRGAQQAVVHWVAKPQTQLSNQVQHSSSTACGTLVSQTGIKPGP